MQRASLPPNENEMNAFTKICQIAEHGAKLEQHWKALGYSCPKSNWLGTLLPTENSKKSKILYEKLIDCIVDTGLKTIGTDLSDIAFFLKLEGKRLKNDDLQNCLDMRCFSLEVSVEDRFKRQNLSLGDAQRLDNVFKMIQYSYEEVFSEIFKNYKRGKRHFYRL